MTKKLTQSEFVEYCTKLYNGKYSYDDAIYVKSCEKIIITCPKHGNFSQVAAEHKHGKGCKLCANEANIVTFEEFEKRARRIHGDKYNYYPELYTKQFDFTVVNCPSHGDFKTRPHAVMQGCGCKKCANTALLYSTEEFIALARNKHGERYKYDKTDYKYSLLPVEIGCETHGYFKQSATAHLAGRGCPKCALYGYQTQKSGSLYILQDGLITKIGITNLDVNKRISQLNIKGRKFNLLYVFSFEDGQIAKDLESEFLNKLRASNKRVEEVFDGYTECFFDVDTKQLVEDIEERCRCL